MRFYRSKFFIISLCIALLLVLIPSTLSVLGYTDLLRSALKTVAHPFEWVGTKTANAVSGFVSVFADYDELKAENEALRAELEALKQNEHSSEVIEAENTWLKEYLDVKTKHPEMTISDAVIISRQSGNYSTVLTLNRGSVHGIKKNMPIITEDGLFGYIKEVGLDWCKAVSIVESASSVSAYSDRGGAVGVVEGDTLLREDGVCKMTYIDPSADIKPGDMVYTGGGGKIYPAGLLIGTVTKLEADEYTRTLVAYIEPAVDFSDISSTSRVMILTGYGS